MSVEGAIVNYAKQENIDSILIDSTSRSGFTNLLFGSVASKVVTYVSCAVLAVK
jgi:nucleotide-binding universal stress UspA family protein